MVDNCSIHMQGCNQYLQEDLFNYLGILMIPLPPYHLELNPTELVFNTLVQRMKSKQTRSSSKSNMIFLEKIENELDGYEFFFLTKNDQIHNLNLQL